MHPLCVPLGTLILQLFPGLNAPGSLRFRPAHQTQPSLEDRDYSKRRSGSTCSSQRRSWRWSSCTRRAGGERGWHARQVSAATRCSAGVQRVQLRIYKVPNAAAEQEKEIKPEQELERMQPDGVGNACPGSLG